MSIITESRDIVECRLKQNKPEKNYVMKGAYSKKALDIYHLILAPSFACNLRCKHCYLPDHKSAFLPKERVLKLVNEWSDIVMAERGDFGGIFHLKGGEPLILPYLSDVLNQLRELKTLRFMMTTNGINWNHDIVKKLKLLNTALEGNVHIIVSLDGSNDSINAKLRGRGNFDKAVTFVRKLRDEGITVFLNNVIHKDNIDDIDSFLQLAVELDVAQVNFLTLTPKGAGSNMIYSRPDTIKTFNKLQAIWDNDNEQMRNLLAGSLNDILHSEFSGIQTSCECVGGYQGLLYVCPDGATYSCPNLNYHELETGSILNSSLKEVHDCLNQKVYAKVCSSENSKKDCYICKGENFLPNREIRHEQEIKKFQAFLEATEKKDGISYCFSRNF